MLGLTDLIIDNLQRQKDWQSSVRSQQLIRANDTDDLEIAWLRLEMVRLLTQRMDRYDRLLDNYQQPPNLGTADGV